MAPEVARKSLLHFTGPYKHVRGALILEQDSLLLCELYALFTTVLGQEDGEQKRSCNNEQRS